MGEAFDRQALLARFGGDAELLGQIVDLFRESAGAWLDEIRAAHQGGDLVLVKRVAHTLKGSVGNFLARDAAAAALHVEQCAMAGDLDKLAEAIAALEGQIAQLQNCLDALVASLKSSNAGP